MQACRYDKSGEQCNAKMKKLRLEYRKIKNKHGKIGEGRKNWKYFEAMDDILGHKPVTEPPVVDTSDAAVDVEETSEDQPKNESEQREEKNRETWSFKKPCTTHFSRLSGMA